MVVINFLHVNQNVELLSDKTPSNAKITLIEDDEVISSDNETADVLNTFFSNTVSNLNIPEYPISNPYYNKIRVLC